MELSVELDVPATMRDGVVLRANVYRPAGEGRWPVLLTRLPYGKDLPLGSSVLDPVQAVRRGYVVIVQDCRGRFRSGGDWVPHRHEWEDGEDTVNWAAGLPYADGQVGMYGASYFGFTQWTAAAMHPPALKALVPFITWRDPLNGVVFRGGALELGIGANWMLQMEVADVMRRHAGDPAAVGRGLHAAVRELDRLGSEGYRETPLAEFGPILRTGASRDFLKEAAGGPGNPDLAYLNVAARQAAIDIPALNVGGWYDIFLQDTIDSHLEMARRGVPSKLLLGPWSHGSQMNPVGEANFGFGSQIGFIDLRADFASIQLRWFDHWLKGIDTGMMSEPPVKHFVMGENRWRERAGWPPPEAVATDFHLREWGGLTLDRARDSELSEHYEYNPDDPAPTRGGNLLMSPDFRSGPHDQVPLEGRRDVLTFTTDPLAQDLEVSGPVRLHLYASSSAPDTDFVARLCDAAPDGRTLNLADGIVRARYRESVTEPSLLEAGEVYEFLIDLWSTSNVFRAGHRIHLQITSSSFPRWDRNLNVAEEPGMATTPAIARQTVHHDPDHPSRLVLPVIPIDPAGG